MATMNVSLDDDLKAFASSERVRERGFATVSEYVRHLIRTDRELDRVRTLVREGLESGPSEPFPEDHFENLRDGLPEG